MPLPKKDSSDSRSGGASGRVQNGNRSGFRTDTAISSNRFNNERTLKPWIPDSSDAFGDSLETSTSSGHWDQFAANEKLFGLQTDYDENMYTTAIDKSHPQYKERMAAAERKAREIERSVAATSHVAEERIMDFVGGDDRNGDEEDKYSGVKRQDSAFSSGRENKYTPPAKRAPTSKATVVGAPVDPAIISSQLKVNPAKKSAPAVATPVSMPATRPATDSKVMGATEKVVASRAEQPKPEKATDSKIAETSTTESKASEKVAPPLRSPAVPPASSTRGTTPKPGEAAPSAAATVERDLLKSFKNFAAGQRSQAERVRISKTRADKEVKLTELKNFANTFKLSTPVPNDLIGIIAKDPARQKEIQAKALQNAEEVLRAKETAKAKEVTVKETQSKQATEPSTPAASEQKPAPRPTPVHTTSHPNSQNRHGGGRQTYGSSGYNGQQYNRNDRSGQHQAQGRPTGNLAQRLKMQQTPHVAVQMDGRLPPTAPTGAGNDGAFNNRRLSGTPGHGNKLNPNTQEFRPNAFAPSFSPAGHPSTASSPRSTVTNSASPVRQIIRRKTKGVDCKKCDILSCIKTIKPPQGRNWEDNAGLRPTYDTPPTWRQRQDDNEKPDSTMLLTYKQYFERNPFAGPPGTLSTPNPAHVLPHLAHQHQLPFHLQHGAHNMPARPSPHMPPVHMHVPPQHTPHVGYANAADDHRMMHSNSAQSFSSPRIAQAPVYPPAVNSPAQVPYGQPVMQPFVPNAPHMGQYRSFSNNPQYMPQQPGHMGAPMMIQPQFVTGPQGMMVTPPQMQMYPTSQAQFMPPGAVAVPPQPIAGSNGYPSPGRPAAPPMAHQGSAQGQPYGMSPSMAYQQPVYTPQQPSPMNNARGSYVAPAAHHYGSSPQHIHHFGGPQHRGGGNYGNKNFTPHGQQHQLNLAAHGIPSGPQGRVPDVPEEAK